MGLPLFGTVVNLNLTTNNTEIQMALGTVTFVHLTASTALNVIGLVNTGGNVEGLVVCFVNEGSQNIAFLHDSSLESVLANRFMNFAQGNKLIGPLASVAYRYNTSTARWHHLWSSF